MRSAAAALLLALLIAPASAFVPENAPAPLSTRSARGRAGGVAMKAAKAKKTKSKKAAEETFKKPQFVASIADKTGLSKAESEAVLAAVLDTIQEEVSEGKRVSLIGFGTFKLTHRSARKGRNPQTGEEIQIKASKSPTFTASKVFKEMCN
eukprot:CAMPEP_0178647056 /NCGR_PEP_ID=MMETSP0698-20121128/19712_1 /TAXON_ID=265572 /ORGANISM="Extubocellulus spinifer, Strain CCMP396" /LENGTH=150 /DNA_ID=CAMNT_0020288269 /DNA_START=33 /DNA_END=485 /DNA_ORIENTATION=-